MADTGLLIVYITCPPGEAGRISGALVTEKLAACVNVVPVKSVYAWQGKLHRDEESLLILKTTAVVWAKLERRVKELHPYEVPEIVALPCSEVSSDYLTWVKTQTGE